MTEASRARSSYVVGLVATVGLLNYYDRNLIGILIQPLKAELHLSDGQIGALSGLAFALIYCLLGLPIARFADRGRRVRVLGLSLALWSVMTALCGFAWGFGSLFAARFGVGVGEAGGLPTTHALVADHVRPKWRATALSLTSISGAIGTYAATGIGGIIAEHYGWRTAFWSAGLPGLLVATLVLTTIREPVVPPPSADAPASTMVQDVRQLLAKRSFLFLCLGLGTVSIGLYGALIWTPAYLMRGFDLSPATVGLRYAGATLPLFLVGSLAGGMISDRLARRDRRWPLWIVAATFAVGTPLQLAVFLAPTFKLALVACAANALVGSVYTGPAFSLIQGLSGARLRATGAAIFLVIGNLAGLGFGPSLVGLLSDAFAAAHGKDSLRMALTFMPIFYIIGVALFLLATRTLERDASSSEMATEAA